MPTSPPAVDRPTSSVAIVGTDAVLAAAPATPVQLAHACLQRGYTVAVPASWGDELIASETLRRLATWERGPAVMCVCPLARERLLGPGADLAPFLVSLVSPPVAVARYLRSVYGEHGVHVTYIGACPGADDPSIDVHLTPDAFIAELADFGIALSEQPLVFDSIVPPDRRRWCSLPGGVPNADTLWADTDGRTIVEIERGDATTELAQHIIAREHVLLDLAPSLGCACSGAVGLVSPDRARALVTAAEPPRALSPVIDAAVVVSLDVPVAPVAPEARPDLALAPDVGSATVLERVLDELLGSGVPAEREPRLASASPSRVAVGGTVILDLPDLEIPDLPPPEQTVTSETIDNVGTVVPEQSSTVSSERGAMAHGDTEPDSAGEPAVAPALTLADLAPPQPASMESPADDATDPSAPAMPVHGEAVATLGDQDSEPPPASLPGGIVEPMPTGPAQNEHRKGPAEREPCDRDELAEPEHSIRQRTPPATLRYATSAIPKATVANGKPLPRAYVAKRRTPPVGAAVIPAVIDAAKVVLPPPDAPEPSSESPGDEPASSTSPPVDVSVVGHTPSPPGQPAPETSAPLDTTVSAAPIEPPGQREAPVPREPATVAPALAPPYSVGGAPPEATPPVSRARAASAAARSTAHPALVFLFVTALVALAVFVLLTLQR